MPHQELGNCGNCGDPLVHDQYYFLSGNQYRCTPCYRNCPATKWDRRFLGMAKLVASWSKDPSTQTGAVIVDPDRRVVSVGYNGFAKGTKDNPERYANRDYKYEHIVHCERNAVIFAKRDLNECTLYTWPFHSCTVCAGMMIQAGIVRVVAPKTTNPRWVEQMQKTFAHFRECGVEVVETEYARKD
jgi:dCMP deaminase